MCVLIIILVYLNLNISFQLTLIKTFLDSLKQFQSGDKVARMHPCLRSAFSCRHDKVPSVHRQGGSGEGLTAILPPPVCFPSYLLA